MPFPVLDTFDDAEVRGHGLRSVRHCDDACR